MSADNTIPRLEVLKNLGFYPHTILDIGAEMGHWTGRVGQVWPEAKIFMVEANRDHESELKNIPGTLGYEIALLGDKKRGKVEYFASIKRLTGGNSIYKEQTTYFDECEIRHLPMTTLDVVVAKHKLKEIDFIKIDTQGSELNILKGAIKTIKRPEFVLLETQNREYNLGAPKTLETMKAMDDFGFYLFDVTEMHYLPSGEMIQIDMIFCKKESRFNKKGILI